MEKQNILTRFTQLGQSIWYDNIQRSLLKSGELARMIERGEIRGVTSNPTIFQNAIAKSNDYNDSIQTMSWAGADAESIFYGLAIQDIRAAADLFTTIYQKSDGIDGYVSLEVSPLLAHDTVATIAEAKRLWQTVNRPNLMIKIPATLAGIPAIKEVIEAGINVNVTLIFSVERYQDVMDAYLRGIEARLEQNLPVNNIASVASFFVSRVDTKVDDLLQQKLDSGNLSSENQSLLGKTANANAAIAYTLFEEIFNSPRFLALKSAGAQYQRPLWASTSTKNPVYDDLIYVENLIAPHTVNTVPPKTLDAIRDHGTPEMSLANLQKSAPDILSQINKIGIYLSEVTRQLEEEGIKSFSDSFTSLLNTIETRRLEYVAELGNLHKPVQLRMQKLTDENIVSRMFSKDPTVWTTNIQAHAEIKNRLGWLDSPISSQDKLSEISEFSSKCKEKGFTHAILLGMGGSSMAPEVFASIGKSFGLTNGGLQLVVLDTTDPRQLLNAARTINPMNALFIVASKSGSTTEVDALFSYFWHLTYSLVGENCGEHFIAITDPGTSLEKLGQERNFARIFLADPSIGGRYSSLTVFGLVPAALCGMNIRQLLNSASSVREFTIPGTNPNLNRGLVLGAILGEAVLHGVDKLTILSDPELSTVGAWLEQLIAESSGKTGKGIIPVDGEPVMSAKYYQQDRLFVYLKHTGAFQEVVNELQKVNQPVLTLNIPDGYALGTEMYTWEYATAIACAILGVNAFDQPDVQDSKTRTQNKIKSFIENGSLLEQQPAWEDSNYAVFPSNVELGSCQTVDEYVTAFLRNAKPTDYIAINAYVPRDPAYTSQLQHFRKQVMQLAGCTTTLGFGPRFLHSTGQLHKGGPDNCLVIQITLDFANQDLKIPGKPFTFGTLQAAQAQGDLEALQAHNRKILRLHLKSGAFPELFY